MGMEEVIVVVDSGAAENVMPRTMFPKISAEETERSNDGKWFKGPGGEHIKTKDSKQVMSLSTLEGVVRKKHVAGCRREKTLCVGISHHRSRQRPVHREV